MGQGRTSTGPYTALDSQPCSFTCTEVSKHSSRQNMVYSLIMDYIHPIAYIYTVLYNIQHLYPHICSTILMLASKAVPSARHRSSSWRSIWRALTSVTMLTGSKCMSHSKILLRPNIRVGSYCAGPSLLISIRRQFRETATEGFLFRTRV